jgi:hypothetical protein
MKPRRLFYENGLSFALFALFLCCWLVQILVGHHAYNEDQGEHNQADVSLGEYLASGHFIEATAENWESEFLQMAAFVWFTSFLFQKGSPESKSPGEPDEKREVTKDSPWPVRRGGLVRKLYENSLSLTLLMLFVFSFLLHAWGGAREYSQNQVEHGLPGVSMAHFMTTSHFWFESMQNWQSEFLSIGVMVVLSIFLRQKGSPESKPVERPHWVNE